MYKISKRKDDVLEISHLWSVVGLVRSPPPLLPVRWTARPINFFPFLPRTPLSLLVIYQLFALHGSSHFVLTPPLSNDLRGSSTLSQIKEERSSREGGKQRQTLPKTLCARGMHSQKESQGPLLGQNPTSGFCWVELVGLCNPALARALELALALSLTQALKLEDSTSSGTSKSISTTLVLALVLELSAEVLALVPALKHQRCSISLSTSTSKSRLCNNASAAATTLVQITSHPKNCTAT